MPAPAGPDPPREADSPPTEASATRGTVVAPLGLPAGARPFDPPAARGEVGTLGPYRIVRELGRGGMGAVYAAVDTRLNRPVALKVMLPQYAVEEGARERFLREARAAAQVVHDNVVTVHEADVRDGIPYIAMQFLEGTSLDAYLRKNGAPTVQQVLRIAREAAAGLAAAHARGLVHRDIKPANLWLEAPEGRVKVLDFGLARPVNAEVEITTSGAVVGTPAYMSPEQGRGEKVDHRTDLFSLGAVLYRLVTGRPPFNGPNAMAVLTALATQEPTPVRELNPAVPEPLAALIHELLAKKLDERPQSGADVARRAAAIEAALSAASSSQPQVLYVPIRVTDRPQANPFTDLDLSGNEAFPSATDPTETDPAPRKSAGRRLWAALGLAVVLAVVGGAVIFFKTKNPTDAKTDLPDNSVAAAPGKDNKSARPVALADPDRKAAEWVLSLGGVVYLNGTDQRITASAELPKEHFTLTGVRLSEKKVTDADLVYLKDLKDLSALHLSGTQITNAGLPLLKDLKNLHELFLDNTAITDAGLVHLNDLTGLKTLVLAANDRITDAGLKRLTKLKELTTLNLGQTGVTGTGLAHFKGLNSLWLHHAKKVSDEGLAHVKELKELKDLNLGDTAVTDAGLARLKELPKLTVLRLYQTGVTNAGLAHLKDCTGLTDLWLSKTSVTDTGLEHLTHLKGLKELGLNDTAVTDTGLEHLKNCPALARLTLLKAAVTLEGLAGFAAARPAVRIEHALSDRKAAEWVLSMGGGVRVNDEMRKIRDNAELPKDRFTLTAVDLIATATTDNGLIHLKDLAELKDLWLPKTKVTDAGLAHLKNLKALENLSLGATGVTGAGLPDLKGLKELTNLYLGGTKVTDAGLIPLKDFTGLKTIDLSGTSVGNAGLAHLKDLPGLARLWLNDSKVTDDGLLHVKELTALSELTLLGTAVTDVGLGRLKTLTGLKQLDVRKTRVTPKGLAEFHAVVPGCKITHDGGVIEPKK